MLVRSNVAAAIIASWPRRAAALFSLSLLLADPAGAVVGEVDISMRYPFVVQLTITDRDGGIGYCSGTISRGGLVSTAAHCIWDPKTGLAEDVTITYRGTGGEVWEARQVRIFYPDAFRAAYATWKEGQATGPSQQNTINFMKMTLEDIAFIVPSRYLAVEGFPHWGTDLLDGDPCSVTVDDLDRYGDRLPPRCARQFTPGIIAKHFGEVSGGRALAVGFGNHSCADYILRKSCVSDGQRRWAEVPLIGPVSIGSNTYAAPDIWCTGATEIGFSPVQRGDSGGPRFVKARDGRWIFVGFTSGGNSQRDCSSSIFRHLDLWREAAEAMDSIELPVSVSDEYDLRQMVRFMEEALSSWSSDNREALLRLPTLYPSGAHINGEELALEALVERKSNFTRQWPKREFKIDMSVPPRFSSSSDGDPIGTLTVRVAWSVQNPERGTRANGVADFEYMIWYGRTAEIKIAYGQMGQPEIRREKCFHVSGDPMVLNCAPSKDTLYWMHNGSLVRYDVEGEDHLFVYEQPSDKMRKLVEPGEWMFWGKRVNRTFSGLARLFSQKCDYYDYDVSGEISADGSEVVLFGRAPKRDQNCQIIGWRDDVLRFTKGTTSR